MKETKDTMSLIHSRRFTDGLIKVLDIDTRHITHISIDVPVNGPVTLKVHSLLTVDQADKLNEVLKEYELTERTNLNE